MTKRFTAQFIAAERTDLSDAIEALRAACVALGRIVTRDKAAGENAGAHVVGGWISEINDLSDVIDGAYGETFWLDGIEAEPAAADCETRP